MQIRTLKLLTNLNQISESNNNNQVILSRNVPTIRDMNSWIFNNSNSTSTTTQARICTFNYTSNSSSSSSSAPTYHQLTAHIWDYVIEQPHINQETIQCHDIAIAYEICMNFRRNVATYSESDFRVKQFIADTSFPLARHIVRPKNTRSLNVLGWTDDIDILNTTMYPVNIQNNSLAFMCALWNIGHPWLGASIILPPQHVVDPDSPCVSDPDNYSIFWPKCTRYNPPESQGSYVSQFTSHTSHKKLIIRLGKKWLT